MVKQVISGGQTGVDRAALDVALELGLPCGGWCPNGRRAEDGQIAARYPLKETPSDEYAQRTEWNVRDSDGTLILTTQPPTGGTAMTIEMAIRLSKPYFLVDLTASPRFDAILNWIKAHKITILNIAGPRESNAPGIYQQAFRFLRGVLSSVGRQ